MSDGEEKFDEEASRGNVRIYTLVIQRGGIDEQRAECGSTIAGQTPSFLRILAGRYARHRRN